MVNIVSKFQVPSSNGLEVMMVWIYFHKVLLTLIINEWINDGGVCRTAPATPGLLNIQHLNLTIKNGMLWFLALFLFFPHLVLSCSHLLPCAGVTARERQLHIPASQYQGHLEQVRQKEPLFWGTFVYSNVLPGNPGTVWFDFLQEGEVVACAEMLDEVQMELPHLKVHMDFRYSTVYRRNTCQ